MNGSDFKHEAAATMVDVARAAGVARVTVSRVLNNTENVTHEKRAAVLSAVKRLGYSRNVNARILAGQRSKIVGVVAADLSIPWIATAIGALSDALSENGFQLFVAQSGDDFRREKYLIEGYVERRIDGLIFLGKRGLKELNNKNYLKRIPVIAAWKSRDDLDISSFIDLLINLNHQLTKF